MPARRRGTFPLLIISSSITTTVPAGRAFSIYRRPRRVRGDLRSQYATVKFAEIAEDECPDPRPPRDRGLGVGGLGGAVLDSTTRRRKELLDGQGIVERGREGDQEWT